MFRSATASSLRARRFLAKYGDELAFDLIDHKEADLAAKPGADGGPPLEDLEKLDRFRRCGERANPHRSPTLRSTDGSDRGRLHAGARSSAVSFSGLTPRRRRRSPLNTRRATRACAGRSAEGCVVKLRREGGAVTVDLIDWDAPGAVPRRVLHPDRRHQRRRVRLAESRDPHRGRCRRVSSSTAHGCATRSAPIPTARRWPGSGTARR